MTCTRCGWEVCQCDAYREEDMSEDEGLKPDKKRDSELLSILSLPNRSGKMEQYLHNMCALIEEQEDAVWFGLDYVILPFKKYKSLSMTFEEYTKEMGKLRSENETLKEENSHVAKWMDKCHELEAEVERLKVSREGFIGIGNEGKKLLEAEAQRYRDALEKIKGLHNHIESSWIKAQRAISIAQQALHHAEQGDKKRPADQKQP